MKRTLLLLITLCMLCLPLLAEDAEESPWNIYTELDMYLGFKAGIRYNINDNIDLISSFGLNVNVNSRYCYSTYFAYHTLVDYDKFKIDVNFGIIQGVFDNTSSLEARYLLVNPGVTMHISYPIADGIYIGAQGGMVLMIAYAQESWAASLEPYVGITFTFSEKSLFKK